MGDELQQPQELRGWPVDIQDIGPVEQEAVTHTSDKWRWFMPVEMQVTKSMKQESHHESSGRLKKRCKLNNAITIG